MPEPDVRQKMESMQAVIETYCAKLDELGKKKAETLKAYRKKTAICLIGLREGERYKIGEKQVREPPPVSILKDIVKGITCEEVFERDIAESAYKACITKIEAAKAILNAQQSIWRHSE